MSEKIDGWVAELRRLAEFAETQPHAAFAALTHGLINRWTYVMRTSTCPDDLFQPLENALHQVFLPSLTGQPTLSQQARDLLSLPARLGGLGIMKPTLQRATQMDASKRVCRPLVDLILKQDGDVLDARSMQLKM